MTKKRRQALALKAETAIATEHGMTVDQVNAAFDQHPIETNKDRYLRRQLARALFTCDELECIFCAKTRAGDVAAGTLLVKINERRSSLLGLNSPPGLSVNVVHGPPQHQESSTDRIERVLNELVEMDRKAQGSAADQDTTAQPINRTICRVSLPVEGNRGQAGLDRSSICDLDSASPSVKASGGLGRGASKVGRGRVSGVAGIL
jgi:hypothetical protein